MILSMTFQIQLACIGFFLGILGALAYDIVRIMRVYIAHSKFGEFFEDYIFWVIYGLVVFLCCLKINYGEIRPFFLFSLFTAMIVYYFFVTSIIHYFTIPAINIIIKILKTVLSFFSMPILILVRFVKISLKFIYIFFENTLQISKKYEKIKRKFVRPYFRGVLNERKENGKFKEEVYKDKFVRKKKFYKKNIYKKGVKKEK